jgi:hypothetical protein
MTENKTEKNGKTEAENQPGPDDKLYVKVSSRVENPFSALVFGYDRLQVSCEYLQRIRFLLRSAVEGLIRKGSRRMLLTVCYALAGLFLRGFDFRTAQKDLPALEQDNTAEACYDSFQVYWEKEKLKEAPKYWKAIVSACKWGFVKAISLAVLFQALQLVGPILITNVTTWVDDKTQPLWLGSVQRALIVGDRNQQNRLLVGYGFVEWLGRNVLGALV